MVICLGHVSVPLCGVNEIKPTEFTFSSDFLTIGLHLKWQTEETEKIRSLKKTQLGNPSPNVWPDEPETVAFMRVTGYICWR